MLRGKKNIIFDFGAVIINLDYTRTTTAFKALGIQNFDTLYSHASQTTLFDDLEMGKLPYARFREEVRKHVTEVLTDQQIDDAWNAMLLDIPAERIQLLQKLKKKYRLFLLSNTNERHYQHYTEYVQKTYGTNGLEDYFEKTYFSHQIGMRKPNANIFHKVIDENKLNLSETLFIDDTERHIKGAMNVGLHVHWLKPNQDIVSLLG